MNDGVVVIGKFNWDLKRLNEEILPLEARWWWLWDRTLNGAEQTKMKPWNGRSERKNLQSLTQKLSLLEGRCLGGEKILTLWSYFLALSFCCKSGIWLSLSLPCFSVNVCPNGQFFIFYFILFWCAVRAPGLLKSENLWNEGSSRN